MHIGPVDAGLTMVNDNQQMRARRCRRLWHRRATALEKVANLHQLLNLSNVLVARGMKDERLPAACNLKVSAWLIDSFGQGVQHGAHVTPVQVARKWMLKDRI